MDKYTDEEIDSLFDDFHQMKIRIDGLEKEIASSNSIIERFVTAESVAKDIDVLRKYFNDEKMQMHTDIKASFDNVIESITLLTEETVALDNRIDDMEPVGLVPKGLPIKNPLNPEGLSADQIIGQAKAKNMPSLQQPTVGIMSSKKNKFVYGQNVKKD